MANGLRRKIAKWAGYGILGALCYVVSGNCYNAIRQTVVIAGITGKNNRELNKEFYSEFENERQALESRLKQNDRDKAGVEISLNLYVNPMLKYFYDDANDPEDNSGWAKEVESAISGLEVFEDLGYDFRIENVYAVPSELDPLSIYDVAYFIEENYNTAEFNISFATNPAQRLGVYERLKSEIVLGKGFLRGSHSLIYLTNDTATNRRILAHEAGHMFGLDDEEIEEWKHMLDPNCFFFIRLMTQNAACESYSLNEEEIAIIKKAKERFD
ncbi:MAG: hypothetical protein QME12_05535 [Nanoarchaeota archaeon]|nr:hypothetical protein [Nanoarchaeota archaeon]